MNFSFYARTLAVTIAIVMMFSSPSWGEEINDNLSSLQSERHEAELSLEKATNDSEQSLALDRLGELDLALGNLDAAMVSFQKSLTIKRSLAKGDPDSPAPQFQVVVTLTRVGDVQMRQSDYDAAQSTYEEQLEIVRQRVAADPKDDAWQALLLTNLHQLGDVKLAKQEFAPALKMYNESLEVAGKALAAAPKSAKWRYDSSICHLKIGDTYLAQGDGTQASVAFVKSLEILRELAAADQGNAKVLRDLIVSLVKAGELAKDRSYFREALDVALAMEKSGILASQDSWMIKDLQERAAVSSMDTLPVSQGADFCPAIRSAIEHGKTGFSGITGEQLDEDDETYRKTSLSPEWGKNCAVTQAVNPSWGCNAYFASGIDRKAGLTQAEQKILSCLDENWEISREEAINLVDFSKGNLRITLMGYDTYVSILATVTSEP